MGSITIETVLGGQGPTSHFGNKGQFRASLGIDPAQPMDDADSAYSSIASGLLRPVAAQNFAGSTLTKAPMWMVPNPKDNKVYILDTQGSAYTTTVGLSSVSALADGGSLSSGGGNGSEYNDNYIYFAKNTDIARYGPLNGAPAFNGSYWVSTLGMTALTNTAYPTDFNLGLNYPNHILHRHSDGKMYITDVVGNLGALHYVSTSFTSVEGDTNNGSTYNKLNFGYGLWPTALESYGQSLVIALYEGSSVNLRQTKAKVGFWDTVSTNFNQITWVEFPDPLVTAVRNANGGLYFFSGNYHAAGFRITKYLGGYSFQEVFYSETGEPPFGGAVDAILSRVLAGTYTTVPENAGCVYSVGLQKEALGKGIFNVARITGPSTGAVTSVCVANNDELGFYGPIVGWAGDGQFGIDKQGTTYSNAPAVWWSSMYRIGAPFTIDAIHIPFAQAMGANMTVTPKIYVDNGISSQTLQVLNNATYPNSERSSKTLRNIGVRGEHSFWLEFRWTGSALLTLGLPIVIDFTLIPD